MDIQSFVKPDGARILDYTSLWYYEKENILYSGFTGGLSPFTNQTSVPPRSLWTFKPNGTGGGVWSEVIPPTAPTWTSLASVLTANTAYDANNTWISGCALPNGGEAPGMVQFDMKAQSFTNDSVNVNVKGITQRGSMHFVPSFGLNGIYVSMGGYNTDGTTYNEFTSVAIFDPSKQEWWNQSTLGPPPAGRIDFCKHCFHNPCVHLLQGIYGKTISSAFTYISHQKNQNLL